MNLAVKNITIYILFSLQFVLTTGYCQALNDFSLNEKDNLDEITGIIVDRTITLMGHEFYRSFTNHRQLNQPEQQYNLTVFERPSARWGSMIWIEYQNQKIFQAFLSPGKSTYLEIAEQAAELVDDKLNRLRLEELLSDHIDLERDEI